MSSGAVFLMGALCGASVACIAAAAALFLKVAPDFQAYERELERRGYQFGKGGPVG